MGFDRELVIKERRRSLGTKIFGTLFEYAKDFINFIKCGATILLIIVLPAFF
jgi:hypothetical protein